MPHPPKPFQYYKAVGNSNIDNWLFFIFNITNNKNAKIVIYHNKVLSVRFISFCHFKQIYCFVDVFIFTAKNIPISFC